MLCGIVFPLGVGVCFMVVARKKSAVEVSARVSYAPLQSFPSLLSSPSQLDISRQDFGTAIIYHKHETSSVALVL